MKKYIINRRIILLTMKFGFFPIIMLWICMGVVNAGKVSGQELLQQHVSLNVYEKSVRSVLKDIEKQTKARFVYSTQVISASQKVTLRVSGVSLSSALQDLLSPLNLTYKVSGPHIVLDKAPNGEEEKKVAAHTGRRIKGVVTDEKNEAMPGVSIVVKGTQQGTVTDATGSYQLDADESAVLIFSYIGYVSQEVKVGNLSSLHIRLAIDTKSLNEVLVIGYGSTTRRDLTGSVSSISSKDFKNHPMNDFSQVLQGRAPGIAVTNTTGAPGQLAKIRIRGANSATGSNDPLIIVDGIPATYEINVNDIKSVEILKDASATAIYGSRGANGVILITTLRGDSGAPRITLTSNVGISKVRKMYDLLEAADYAALANITYGSPKFTTDQISAFRQNGGTDWQKEIFRTGLSQNYQVSVSGGSDKVKYLVSGNLIDEKGTLINTDRKKYSFRTNLNADFGKRLTMGFDINFQRNERNNPDMGNGGSKANPIFQSLLWSPTSSVYNADGTYNKADPYGALGQNPVLLAKEPVDKVYTQVISLNTNLKYQILEGLSVSGIASLSKTSAEGRSAINAQLSTSTSATRTFDDRLNWQVDGLVNYEKNFFAKHSLSATGGVEAFVTQSDNFSTTAAGITDYYNLGTSSSVSSTSGYGYASLLSYFGRLNYNFAGKYFITATYRADGSSKFRDENKWGFFPSTAVSWLASEEDFVKNLNVFDNLKIRASWGITGNQAVKSYATLSSLGTTRYAFGSSTRYSGTRPSSPANTSLRWEETTQMDVGIDFSILKNKLSGSFDFFSKKTEGVLLNKPIALYDGGYNTLLNVGRIDNKGFELSLDYRAVEVRNFGWAVNFNFTTLRNKVVNLGPDTKIFGALYGSGIMNTSAFVLQAGNPMGSFWGMRYLGIWSEAESDQAMAFGNKPGDSKYQDINNDKIINASDYQIIGNSNPKFSWGLNNAFTYKNWALDVLIQGVEGRKVYNMTYATAAVLVPDSRTITLQEAADIWTPSNQDAQWPAVSTTNTNYMNSSRWLQDGSYVKVRNISINYTIPRRVTKVGDIKLSLSGQNLFTITRYQGFDPEVSSSGNSDLDSGIDFGVYPTSKLITAGLMLNF
ncbi:TonB-dependent receptor P3 [Dyadobacter sp. CECT 9275]|uniref:TonB-dependent receptor P3 n=1 Tax=Dyadobacter helix TaxID=2822344 RepID=A0A916JFP5_9BACT|nr:TonB-dependent receptor [Dyadobacter sp. CECT 9275]CAG5008888.1 TonB-dependent receptor P3 [Dyadobacter sp. CECT 9275]